MAGHPASRGIAEAIMLVKTMRKLRGTVALLGTASTLVALVIPLPPMPGILPSTWPGAPTWWSGDGNFSGPIGDLRQFIDALQRSLERLMQWVQAFQQTASDILARMIWEPPGQLPDEADLTGLIKQIRALPEALRRALEALRDKLQAPVAAGSVEERHHRYIESNPALVHEAVGIAETDQVVGGGMVQQAAASQATAVGAAAVSRDLRPETAGADARETSDAITSVVSDLPSSRAGIELLITGMGASLRQQADLGSATADRLTVLVQQTAQVSQQVGALAATAGALTLRQAERDRRALNGQLGLADAVSTVAQMLQDVLTGAGDPVVDEPRLNPLY
jgi:hypothetical protein